MTTRPPVPPFTRETAAQKVQGAEDGWNTRDPERVSLAYTEDSEWRNRDWHVVGRARIVEFLTQKWERELDYALRKSMFAFEGNRIAVRYQYGRTTARAGGSAATATSCGSSTTPASCGGVRRASTTSPSPPRSAASSDPARSPSTGWTSPSGDAHGGARRAGGAGR